MSKENSEELVKNLKEHTEQVSYKGWGEEPEVIQGPSHWGLFTGQSVVSCGSIVLLLPG